jgi:hypothetical protein
VFPAGLHNGGVGVTDARILDGIRFAEDYVRIGTGDPERVDAHH